MTVEEKLNHFFDSSVSDARAQSAASIEEYRNTLEKDFEEYKNSMDSQAAIRLKMEETKIKSDMNHELSDRLLTTKREFSEKYDELKALLFDEVRKMLSDFRKTDEYKNRIIKNIEAAVSYADNDSLTVYIDPEDASLIDELKGMFPCNIIPSAQPFGGGIRAVIDRKNILIDNSYNSKLEEIADNFTFDGGSSNE